MFSSRLDTSTPPSAGWTSIARVGDLDEVKPALVPLLALLAWQMASTCVEERRNFNKGF